jgi:branched-chain amino acid transport system ATP-binding protein
MAFLEVSDIHTYYGNIQALKGITLEVNEGECVTLIGSNGAGKSTTLRSISGLTAPRTGSIKLGGEEISMLPPQEIVRLGICQSPEGRKCFSRMTVRENLELGAYLRRDSASILKDLDRVYELFPPVADRRAALANTLSGGERQMLVIGRALMASPSMLLLDEPSLGLAPRIVGQIFELLHGLVRDEGLTVLLVEQNARSALSVAHRGVVLNLGKVVADQDASVLAADDQLRHAYLGF